MISRAASCWSGPQTDHGLHGPRTHRRPATDAQRDSRCMCHQVMAALHAACTRAPSCRMAASSHSLHLLALLPPALARTTRRAGTHAQSVGNSEMSCRTISPVWVWSSSRVCGDRSAPDTGAACCCSAGRRECRRGVPAAVRKTHGPARKSSGSSHVQCTGAGAGGCP